MKMIVLPIVFMLFSLVLANPTFSSEKADQELEELAQQKGEIIYMDDEITVRSFGNDTEISDVIFNHPNSVVVNENNPMCIHQLLVLEDVLVL
ncbi:hypothetical protein [Peribacillus simplex]|uniref:hypothetical protein n=1 Tax=Peribacillus simplex TaxID=1478 RepID=UPI0036DE1372